MERRPEPELELIRRAAPFAVLGAVLALVVGALAGGWDVGLSAAAGVCIVGLNFAASGFSLAWAARISLVAIAVVVMGGFVVRMSLIVAIMFVLDRFASWFSPLAFGLAVVPATILLLVYELKLLASGVGRELILPAPDRGVAP
jgi:hypothetical protein